MDINVLKNVLSEETFSKVQEETSEVDGRLADLSKGGYVSSDKYSALEEQLSSTQSLLEKKTEDFDALKSTAGDNEELRQQIDSLKSTYEAEKADLKNQYEEQLKQSKIRAGIIENYKPKDVNDILSHIDMSKIKIDEDKITGLKEQVDALKETKAYYFEEDNGGSTGLDHGGKTQDYNQIRRAMGLKDK